MGCWCGCLSGARCRLAYGPADATATHCLACFSKIQIGFTFLVPAHLGSPGQRVVKWVGVCVCCVFVTSVAFLSRCIPDPHYLLAERFSVVKKFLAIIELDDLFRKILSDIYTAWREILGLCGIAVGKCSQFSSDELIIYL